MINNLKLFLVVLFVVQILFSCKNNVPTNNNQYILWKNVFKGNQKVLDEELRLIIPFSQKENSKPFELPITPRVWWYNFGLNNFSLIKNQRKLAESFEILSSEKAKPNPSPRKIQKREKRIDRIQENINEGVSWFWRNIGEKEVLFSASIVEETAGKIKKYLDDIGYRDANVLFKIDTLALTNKVKVNYIIEEGVGYTIDSIQYIIKNEVVDSIMKANKNSSLIFSGNLFDTRKVDAEKIRIEQLLKNNGYYNFNNKYILHGATNTERDEALFKTQKKGILRFEILNPDNSKHEQFTIEEVVFKAFDPNSSKNATKPDTIIFNDVKFIRIDKGIPLDLISERILSKPYTNYKLKDIMETQRQIGMFNQFAFTSTQIRTIGKNQLGVEYFAPLLEKYTFGISPGINNIYNDGTTFFGFGVPVSLIARNRFHKLETIEAAMRASYEGQPSPINSSSKPNIRGSLELGVNLNVTLPSNRFFGKSFNQLSLKNPRTILGLGYNYSEPFWGKRLNFRLNTNYSIQLNKNAFVYLSLLDANLINTSYSNNKSGRDFYNGLVELQQQGNNLKVTFDPQFVSSLNANYVLNNQNPSKPFSNSKFFRLFLESGGTVLNFLENKNRLGFIEKIFPLNQAENSQDSIRAYFRFLKINADYRRNVNITQKSSYAFRFNLGVTNPYGANRSLPFEKNFFIGGSNSMRAWAPRTLGTGSSPSDTTLSGNTIPQPGDILIETSIEYRLKVFRFAGDIQIAGFIDAGNIWKWHPNPAPNKIDKANFELNRFYEEFAVGTGFGIRWDLSYFLFRFDWGIKVVDPSRTLGQRFVLDEFTLRRNQTYGLNWNFGIGYPF